MTQLFYFPGYQALSSSGTPLGGAKLHFFKTGTSTAEAVYADAARTTALSNPVIADSNGRFPQIYPDPAVVYRAQLTDSSNVQQWQQDGVCLQLFPRTKAEIDANVTPVNYGYAPCDARRYGAIGNGIVNDTDALQDWLDVCAESSDAGYLPRGIYCHDELILTNTTKGFRIYGDSSGDYGTQAGTPPTRGSILKFIGAFDPDIEGSGIALTVDGGGPKYLEIDGITFVGNPNAATAIIVRRATWLQFFRCGWYGFKPVDVPELPDGEAVHLTIDPGTFTGGIHFTQCWWSANDRCVFAKDSPINIVSFIRCQFHSSQYAFYHGATDSSNYIRHLKFIDSHFEENDQDILINGGVAGFSVVESYFEQNRATENNPRIHFAATGSSPLSGAVRIVGNVFSKSLAVADTRLIQLAYCNGVAIHDNWSAYPTSGSIIDRYFVEVGAAVTNYDIEPARSVSGATPYPIRIGGANWAQRVMDQASPMVFRSGGSTVFYPRASDAAADASPQGYLDEVPNNQSGNYTLALSDRNKIVLNGNNMGISYTIPANATVAFPPGTRITIINDSNANMTLTRAAGVANILTNTATDQNVTIASRGMAFLRKIATNRWYTEGTGLT